MVIHLKIKNKYNVGDLVKITNNSYFSYYGFANSVLKVKSIKISNSDNIQMDNQIIYNLETLDKKSIEGECYNPFWVLESDIQIF